MVLCPMVSVHVDFGWLWNIFLTFLAMIFGNRSYMQTFFAFFCFPICALSQLSRALEIRFENASASFMYSHTATHPSTHMHPSLFIQSSFDRCLPHTHTNVILVPSQLFWITSGWFFSCPSLWQFFLSRCWFACSHFSACWLTWEQFLAFFLLESFSYFTWLIFANCFIVFDCD